MGRETKLRQKVSDSRLTMHREVDKEKTKTRKNERRKWQTFLEREKIGQKRFLCVPSSFNYAHESRTHNRRRRADINFLRFLLSRFATTIKKRRRERWHEASVEMVECISGLKLECSQSHRLRAVAVRFHSIESAKWQFHRRFHFIFRVAVRCRRRRVRWIDLSPDLIAFDGDGRSD